MKVFFAARAAALLLVFMAPSGANSQSAAANAPLKEVHVGATAFSLANPTPSWVAPTAIPESDKKAPLVVRLADTQYLVAETPIVYVHRALKVDDAASLTAAGQLAISFVPQYQRLNLHAIHVLRGQEVLDRTTSSTLRFLEREMGLESGLYSGEVTASLLVNDLRVGDTIEYSYTVEGQNPVFGGKFANSAVWDQSVPTALRRVVLNYPVTRQISWRFIGDGQSKPVVPTESTSDGMRKLDFEERSIAEVASEPATPTDFFAYRTLQFSEFSGWDDVVAWADGLFRSDGVNDDELRGIVARLRALPTNEERVTAALEFVQSEIRYFSVSLGESSHRPAAPDIVIKRRYGDCKDKSFLLMSLLKEVGIESRPVLVRLGGRKALEKMLPSPQLFDHVIVQATVDGAVFYLDPTRLGQHGRLSRMGQFHEGAQVLLIAPGVREYSTISSAGIHDLVRNTVTETAVLPKFGADAELKVRELWAGVSAESIRLLFERLPKARLTKLFGDALETRYPGTRLVGEPEIQDDRVDNVFSVTTSYIVPKLATEKDGNWFVRFLPTNVAGALVIPTSSVRQTPLAVPRFPFEASYSFEVRFPEEVSVIMDPTTNTVDDKYFTATVTRAFRGNLSKAAIDFMTLSRQVEPQDIQKFAEDLRSLNTAIGGTIVVPKGSIKSVDPTSSTKDFAQLLRDRLQEGIDKMTDTINSGKLSGKDLAEAYCQRSDAYTDLGKFDEAMRDSSQALRLAPNGSRSFICRAYVYFNTGDFSKAAADYSRAITLGATDPHTFYFRGIVNFYAGRLDDAASDLSRASAANDNESRMYTDLWLSWTSQRLGRPVPEAVAKRAAADPRGDWPQPALAMANGNLGPEEMLKLLDGKSGDERRMALAEANFYLAQHYLSLGDKDKAREYFEKTRQLEVIIYTEHVAAGFELQRLKEVH
jgi:lipoprotein NlpI/transglutaminase-like putative cysteine protease